jgi:hypothetical protein
MNRVSILFLILVTTLLLSPLNSAKAAEWQENSDFFVYIQVGQAEEIPLPMPPAMMAAMAGVHRHFGVNFPGNEVLVFLGDDLLKQEGAGQDKSAVLLISEVIRFNLAMKGLKAFMVEAKKEGISLDDLEFGLEPGLQAGRIREIHPEGGGIIWYRLEGSFADAKWRELMLTALSGKEEQKKK